MDDEVGAPPWRFVGVPQSGSSPSHCVINVMSAYAAYLTADHGDPHVPLLGDLGLKQVGGHGERVIERLRIDSLCPERPRIPVLRGWQPAESLADHLLVVSGEIPGSLHVIGDERGGIVSPASPNPRSCAGLKSARLTAAGWLTYRTPLRLFRTPPSPCLASAVAKSRSCCAHLDRPPCGVGVASGLGDGVKHHRRVRWRTGRHPIGDQPQCPWNPRCVCRHVSPPVRSNRDSNVPIAECHRNTTFCVGVRRGKVPAT